MSGIHITFVNVFIFAERYIPLGYIWWTIVNFLLAFLVLISIYFA